MKLPSKLLRLTTSRKPKSGVIAENAHADAAEDVAATTATARQSPKARIVLKTMTERSDLTARLVESEMSVMIAPIVPLAMTEANAVIAHQATSVVYVAIAHPAMTATNGMIARPITERIAMTAHPAMTATNGMIARPITERIATETVDRSRRSLTC